MRLLIVFSLFAGMLAAADIHPKKSPPVPARKTANLAIPAAAVKADDGSYRYTDRQGKKWIYRKTPFGIARFEDKPVETPAESAQRYANVSATESGDTVRFERPGPFGVYKWQRKKTELDEMEQTVWTREQARATRQD